ncbi:TetR/AcrR family transcriptional regulator [Dactylosporangium sp. CA-092794]|uniref:TetR/AcrR family transcriptional regulator n=1 Tax=Dactylosporangium sp. CA-092794 TaxID=3239929 RepID=UPI003D8C0BAF
MSVRQQRSAEIRSRVLDAALHTFHAKGYHGSSVNEVAQAAGISVPGLYHHFATKQDLLATILGEGVRELFERLERAVETDGLSPAERLDRLVRTLATYQAMHAVSSFLFVSELRSLEPDNRARINHYRLAIQHLFDDVVIDGVREGVFTTDMPLDVSRSIVVLCTNISGWFQASGPLTAEQVAERHVRMARGLVFTVEGWPTVARHGPESLAGQRATS